MNIKLKIGNDEAGVKITNLYKKGFLLFEVYYDQTCDGGSFCIRTEKFIDELKLICREKYNPCADIGLFTHDYLIWVCNKCRQIITPAHPGLTCPVCGSDKYVASVGGYIGQNYKYEDFLCPIYLIACNKKEYCEDAKNF